MKDFPRNVFTSPGPHYCQGGSYGSELVHDEKEMATAISAGFFATIPEALEAIEKPKTETKTRAVKNDQHKN